MPVGRFPRSARKGRAGATATVLEAGIRNARLPDTHHRATGPSDSHGVEGARKTLADGERAGSADGAGGSQSRVARRGASGRIAPPGAPCRIRLALVRRAAGGARDATDCVAQSRTYARRA